MKDMDKNIENDDEFIYVKSTALVSFYQSLEAIMQNRGVDADTAFQIAQKNLKETDSPEHKENLEKAYKLIKRVETKK